MPGTQGLPKALANMLVGRRHASAAGPPTLYAQARKPSYLVENSPSWLSSSWCCPSV